MARGGGLARFVLGAAMAGSVGCQSYASAVRVLCVDAPLAAQFERTSSERRVYVVRYVRENVRNERVLAWLSASAARSVHPGESDPRSTQLRDMAREAGMSACPLADQLDQWAREPHR